MIELQKDRAFICPLQPSYPAAQGSNPKQIYFFHHLFRSFERYSDWTLNFESKKWKK